MEQSRRLRENGKPVSENHLRVSARSSPNAVAGAVAGVVRDSGRAEIHVVGAGALNQAVKAVAIARTYLEPQGVDLVCIPSFAEVQIDGEQRTALSLVMEHREPTAAKPVAELRVEHDPEHVVTDLRVEGDGQGSVVGETVRERPAAT